MRSKLPAFLAIGSSLAALAADAPARADASAWMFVGGGALGWKQGTAADAAPNSVTTVGQWAVNGTMTIDVGAGTSPDARFIGGAFFRIQPVFKQGTDVAALARFCTHGFQAGSWGFAIDAGGFARPWGLTQSVGFEGGVTLGGPLGFTLALQSQVGTASTVGFGAVAGLDLLRLTVYRQTLLDWWQNPSPAWKTKQAASLPGFLF